MSFMDLPAKAVVERELNNPASPSRVSLSATYGTPKLDKTEAAATYRALVRTANTQTATYTLSATDVGKAVEIDSASDTFVVVPSDGGIPVGAEIDVARLGAGAVRIVPQIQNLLSNGSSEAILSASVRGSATAPARSTTSAFVGTYGVQTTSTEAASYGFFIDTATFSQVGLSAGDKVSAAVWLRCPTSVFFKLRFMRAGQTMIEYSSPTTTNGVVKIENVAIPEGATQVMLVTDSVATAAGQLQEFDAAILQAGTTVSTYQDGDTPGAAWSGAVRNSPSYGPALLGPVLNIPALSRVVLRKRSATQWAILAATNPTTTAVALTDRDNGQAGMWAPSASIVTINQSVAVTANRLYLMRVCPSRAMLVTSLGFKVTTASATDDPVDVGIFSAAGVRLVSSGSTIGRLNSTGSKSVTVAATVLNAGQVYYVAFAANSAATLLFASTIADAFGSAMPALDLGSKDASFPIPSTVTGVGVRDSGPIMWVKE